MKVIYHLHIGLHQWKETHDWAARVKAAKETVRKLLCPGQGGPDTSAEENVGVAFDWPDAKVSSNNNNMIPKSLVMPDYCFILKTS